MGFPCTLLEFQGRASSSGVVARSDKYDSVRLEPMRESDPALGLAETLLILSAPPLSVNTVYTRLRFAAVA